MSLRKSPLRTSAFLSANRLNAQKCTGPRTVSGKARSSLNALKHGRYARNLRERLRSAGLCQAAGLWDSAYREIAGTFLPRNPAEAAQAGRFANHVVGLAWRMRVFGTKPECGLFSKTLGPGIHALFPIRIEDQGRRLGLVFWVQRKAYWNLEKALRVMFSNRLEDANSLLLLFTSGRMRHRFTPKNQVDASEPPLRLALEGRVRCRRYRMRYVRSVWERIRLGLQAEYGRPQRSVISDQPPAVSMPNAET